MREKRGPYPNVVHWIWRACSGDCTGFASNAAESKHLKTHWVWLLKCLCLSFWLCVCVVHHWVRSQLLPVRHPEEVAPLHEHQEHHPEGLRRPLQRHLPGGLREVRDGLRKWMNRFWFQYPVSGHGLRNDMVLNPPFCCSAYVWEIQKNIGWNNKLFGCLCLFA